MILAGGGYRVVRGRIQPAPDYPLIGKGTGAAPSPAAVPASTAALTNPGSWGLALMEGRAAASQPLGGWGLGWYALAVVSLILAARS